MVMQADYLELEMPELADHLLRETGQNGDSPTNPTVILDYLKLQFVMIDLATIIPAQSKQPRGILSYIDRVVGVDISLMAKAHRARFTTMHEVGHYVLPNHQNDLYICDDQDLSFEARLEAEQEANAFAAELLFKGDKFTRQANECALSAESIKMLALRYDASFEATTRRFVERSARPCCVAVFGPALGSGVIDTSQSGRWQQRYAISSAEFRTRYFQRLKGDVPGEVVKQLMAPGRDFADSIDDETTVTAATGKTHRLHLSFFTNHHSIFALVEPITESN